MKDKQLGTVYLVGAGPGDPDLLTVKASKLLKQCDAVVYDALVSHEILELVNEKCKCIFVGKRKGHHSQPQLTTNSLLVDLARQYKLVVRLKGGDPFIFGRGGEEASYLYQHGISVEIIPGITSGMAAAAYVGIPLTHRIAGSSVTFVTGHEGKNKLRPSVNWKTLLQPGNTLVIYMGIHNLHFIVQELLSAGCSPKIPVAVIQRATVRGQRCLKTVLDALVQEVEKNKVIAPSIIIIGETVNYQISSISPTLSNAKMPISF